LQVAEPFFLLAGPNVIESEEHVLRMAKSIKDISTKLGLPLVFKSSFDKANRTSSKSFRGPGMAEGLKVNHSLFFELQAWMTLYLVLLELRI
jgi:2-dehydro-3-deoxyphosphooctonate aldolase (KDO 8-P synthase)